jgi:hypothetical protein
MTKHTIIVTTPANAKVPDFSEQWTEFAVDPSFLPVLAEAPAVRTRGREFAYVFGPPFPLSEYKFIGRHKGKTAQTGLIDLTSLEAAAKKARKDRRTLLLDIAAKVRKSYTNRKQFESREILNAVRRSHPWLLMVGREAEYGINIFAHYQGSSRLVDGLILDAGYFFDKRGNSRGALEMGLGDLEEALVGALDVVRGIGEMLPGASQTSRKAMEAAFSDIWAGEVRDFTSQLEDAERKARASKSAKTAGWRYASRSESNDEDENEEEEEDEEEEEEEDDDSDGDSGYGEGEDAGSKAAACEGRIDELRTYAKKRGVAVRKGSRWVRKADLLDELDRKGYC